VASLGVRPTFGAGGARVLEVHLFDIDQNLYGKRLRVEFVRRLRTEKRFSSAAALVRQMERDAARARTFLASPRGR
jgi:riboflavin kinase/FMN adenylyltransferase